MIRVYVVVEGQTEETFVREVLAPFFDQRQTFLIPIILRKRGQSGGDVKYERARRHIVILLKQDRTAVCTTFFDYYGIDPSFPGKAESAEKSSATDKAEIIEKTFGQKIFECFDESFHKSRFIPYIQMHEFEGLLFSNPQAFAKGIYRPHLAANFTEIRDLFPTPEDIDDDTQSAPSKRVEKLFPGYQKPLFGVLAALEIGLDCLRRECPHFNYWLSRIESLSEPTDIPENLP